MSKTSSIMLQAAAGVGDTQDMFTVLDTEELYFNVAANYNSASQNITMSYDDQYELEFRILERSVTNTNVVDFNGSWMVRDGTTSFYHTRVPNAAATSRNQSIVFNTGANTVSVNTGADANFQGLIQIVRFARTLKATHTLNNNSSTSEQTMSTTVTDLSKCFLQPSGSYPNGTYIRGAIDPTQTQAYHQVYYGNGSQNGGIAITGNNKYKMQTTNTGTWYLIEFE